MANSNLSILSRNLFLWLMTATSIMIIFCVLVGLLAACPSPSLSPCSPIDPYQIRVPNAWHRNSGPPKRRRTVCEAPNRRRTVSAPLPTPVCQSESPRRIPDPVARRERRQVRRATIAAHPAVAGRRLWRLVAVAGRWSSFIGCRCLAVRDWWTDSMRLGW